MKRAIGKSCTGTRLTIICWLVSKALGIGNVYSTEQEQHTFVEATKFNFYRICFLV